MVVGLVFREVLKYAGKGLSRYYRLEGKAFNRLYTGFPQSKTIGRGVRHGLTVGSIAGSVINDDGIYDDDLNGIPQRYNKVPTSRKYYKTRSGQTRRYSNRYKSRRSYCPKCRCPSPSK